jgi:hypothetical protein
MTAPARTLLAVFSLLGVAVFIDDGSLGPVSLPLVVAACVLVVRVIQGAPSPLARFTLAHVLAAGLVIDAAVVWIKPPGAELAGFGFAARALVTVSALGAAGTAITPRRIPGLLALAVLLLLVGAAGVLVLHGSPAPRIDVFTIQQEGARDLWHGLDPYRSLFTNPYTSEESIVNFGAPQTQLSHYPYPPLSLVFSAVAWRVTGDVRHAFLLAQLATAAGIYALARRHAARPGIALAFAALVVVHPRGLFVLEQAWTEPLMCAAFVLSVLWLEARGRWRLALVAALALCLAAKQYSLLLLPLCVSRRYFGRRAILCGGLVGAAAIMLPFVVWDPGAFVADVVMFQIQQPFRWASLSVAPVIAFLSGWKPSVLGPVTAIAAMAWSWRRATPGSHGFCLVASALVLGFFVTAKQAFCNYYYFVQITVLCAAITAPAMRDE